ncbi:hypothetical protein CC2G_001913 [Coprinopsis cinerea AmutBmut pab1-1]|nr:hypothetical protein CC2G_001913 [Coprinopsis cinerea AmutBmut pab1-1]
MTRGLDTSLIVEGSRQSRPTAKAREHALVVAAAKAKPTKTKVVHDPTKPTGDAVGEDGFLKDAEDMQWDNSPSSRTSQLPPLAPTPSPTPTGTNRRATSAPAESSCDEATTKPRKRKKRSKNKRRKRAKKNTGSDDEDYTSEEETGTSQESEEEFSNEEDEARRKQIEASADQRIATLAAVSPKVLLSDVRRCHIRAFLVGVQRTIASGRV